MELFQITPSMLECPHAVGEIIEMASGYDPNNVWADTSWTETVITHDVVAWCIINSSNTIVAGKGIGSVTGTSDKQVNFSTALPDANYCVTTSCEASGAGQEIVGVYGRTTTYFKLDIRNYSGTAVTPSDMTITVYGKLETPIHKWVRDS